MNDHPFAYHIIFHTYGSRLHGDEKGSVDRINNIYGTPAIPYQPRLVRYEESLLKNSLYELDGMRRRLVLEAIVEVCKNREWRLHVAHIRTTHVHVMVSGNCEPEKIMHDFKAYASRKLNGLKVDDEGIKRWSRHGITKYVWTADEAERVASYILYEQGDPMEIFINNE